MPSYFIITEDAKWDDLYDECPSADVDCNSIDCYNCIFWFLDCTLSRLSEEENQELRKIAKEIQKEQYENNKR